MAKGLFESQLDTLEEPASGLTVTIDATPAEICQLITERLLGGA